MNDVSYLFCKSKIVSLAQEASICLKLCSKAEESSDREVR